MTSSRIMFWLIASLLGWSFLRESLPAQTARVSVVSVSSSTNATQPDQALVKTAPTNSPTTNDYEPVIFETLAAFPIKVDWLINATNAALDTLRREGEIPARIKALDGKKVSAQGYMKPLKQDGNGVTEFLLMRDHALCCQTNVPRINEWIHVRMTGKSLPFAHERQFAVRGVLHVGEALGQGNVVSVYRLTGDEITPADAR